MCRALGAAHRAGVVHFDIKPQNIMFDRDGLVKVVDFGIAGFVFNTLTTMADASRLAPAGTPDFGAPEQFGPEGGDERADLYALGGVLFAMLTGRAPYTGPNAFFAVINIKMLQPAPRVEQIRGDLPAGLGELVAELLDRDPARRPRTTTLVGERLERIERIARSEARQARIPTQAALFPSRSRRGVRAATAHARCCPAPAYAAYLAGMWPPDRHHGGGPGGGRGGAVRAQLRG